jgi:DNA-binding transcriptional regulator YhcF (GntR family)
MNGKSKTTRAKQAKFIESMLEKGISFDKIQEWYKDPVKSSIMNLMADSL